MVRVKICGITNIDDALMAADYGADALGFVFYTKSPRYVTEEKVREIAGTLPPFVTMTGLFVNEEPDKINLTAERCDLDVIQLHGDEDPECCESVNRRVIKAIRIQSIADIEQMKKYNVHAFLLDARVDGEYGGTGKSFGWEIGHEARKYGRIILAGGLTPENVEEAIVQAKPYAVDVSSGVESSPGKKDHKKVKQFIRRAKGI